MVGRLAAVPARYGLNLAVLDLNGDDRLDVYVGNDSQPNFLLRNDGDFIEKLAETPVKPKKKKKARQRSDESTPSFDDVGGMALGRSTNGYASLGAVRSAFAAGRYGAQNTEFLQRFDAWLQREALLARLRHGRADGVRGAVAGVAVSTARAT